MAGATAGHPNPGPCRAILPAQLGMDGTAVNKTNAQPKTQIEAVLARLREMILQGRFAVHSKLQEVALSEMLGVSRTPVRLALQSLAQEGLLIYSPQRGFTVRGFTVKEIVDAIDVRGRLEAFACEIVATRGLSAASRVRLEENVEETRRLVARDAHTLADVERWAALNEEFHQTIIAEANNGLISQFIEQIRRVPMASAGVSPTTPENAEQVFGYVGEAAVMHGLVLDALVNRQPARAQLLMTEHIYQGRARMQEFISGIMEADAPAPRPALHLVDP